jgi:hypothetical protein
MYMLFYDLLNVCDVLLKYWHRVHVGVTGRGNWFTQHVPLMEIGSYIHRHPAVGMKLIQQSYLQ